MSKRPASAVGAGTGLAGMAGFALWLGLGLAFGMDGPMAGMMSVVACGVPMMLWSLAVEKVHRRASTGIDWAAPPRPWSESLPVSLAKLAGLWATWGIVAGAYTIGAWYWAPPYLFAMRLLGYALPLLVALSIPYVLWLDRRLAEPRDGAHALGRLLIGEATAEDRALLPDHARAWGVKAFFGAFMIAIVPGNWANVIHWPAHSILADPAAFSRWLIELSFLVDVAFATVGYLLTMKPLDAHIRSANPWAAAWMAALICYPPFQLMTSGGPLDYHGGAADWTFWMAGHPKAMALTGVTLALLTAVYAWATVAFGLRFSNLTNRGIVTNGPYALSRHPAYLAKNAFWWISGLPFLVTSGTPFDAVRNCAILALVSGVYWWRARTEERHLMADSAYRAYFEWMERHGPVPRLFGAGRRMLGRSGRAVGVAGGQKKTRAQPASTAAGEGS